MPKRPDEIAALDDALFARIVAATFSQRRKTQKNTLAGLVQAEDFAALGIDPGLHAEALPLAGYEAITRRLAARA